MYVAPLESYESGLFSASIVPSFGVIICIKSPPILKDLTRIAYNYGSHGFLSPKISRNCIKESDTAGALKLWYRGGLGSIGFSRLHRDNTMLQPSCMGIGKAVREMEGKCHVP